MAEATKVIKVAKAKSNSRVDDDIIRLNATLCYFYPAYDLKKADRMPHKHKMIMISQAKRLKAIDMHDFTQICAAPHSKKGVGVKKIAKHFEKASKNA